MTAFVTRPIAVRVPSRSGPVDEQLVALMGRICATCIQEVQERNYREYYAGVGIAETRRR